MRIAVVGPTYPFRGGIAHHTTLLAKHLRERHDVLLLSFARQYPRQLFPGRSDRDPSRSAVKDVDSRRVLAPLRPWTWLRAARLLRAFRPDLVLIQWWVPFWAPSLGTLAALTRRGTSARVVFICHNVVPHDSRSVVDRELSRLALANGDSFVVHSEADERVLRTLLPRQTSRPGSVRRSVLPAFEIAQAEDREEARAALGVAPDARMALFFGFVREYKGVEVLIDATPLVAGRVPKLHVLVAGECWTPREQLERRARELGAEQQLTFDDRYIPNEEVGRYFSAADIVVMPYLEATQSAVVTLAVAFGLPVVATDVGGLPEVVLDGKTGLIVPPGDVPALAEAMARCLSDDELYAALREGVVSSAERFSWSRFTDLVVSMAHPPREGGTSAGRGPR